MRRLGYWLAGLLLAAVTTVAGLVSTSAHAARCVGVIVAPGDGVQAAIRAAPAGSTFCFAPGLYRTGDLRPKGGDVFVGGGQAILTGGGTRWYAFNGDATAPAEVTIKGFRIVRY